MFTHKQDDLAKQFDESKTAAELASWDFTRRENITFYWSPRLVETDGFERGAFVTSREQSWDAIVEFAGGGDAGKVEIYVWRDDADAQPWLERPLGFAVVETGRIHRRWDTTPGHELAHVILWRLLPGTRVKLIQEGIACHLDQSGRDRHAAARRRLVGDEIDILAQWKAGGQIVDVDTVGYAVATAWVERLIREGGRDRSLLLLRDQRLQHAEEIYGRASLQAWADGLESELATPPGH